jgi:hypothetical protein
LLTVARKNPHRCGFSPAFLHVQRLSIAFTDCCYNSQFNTFKAFNMKALICGSMSDTIMVFHDQFKAYSARADSHSECGVPGAGDAPRIRRLCRQYCS